MRVQPFAVGSYVHTLKRGGRGMPIVKDQADQYRFIRSLYYLNDLFFDENWDRASYTAIYNGQTVVNHSTGDCGEVEYNLRMFSEPERNVALLELEGDMKVADFGAGSGFYTVAAARLVRKGRVYAVDVQKDLLERLRNTAANEHLSNIEAVWGDIEKLGGTKLRDASVDAVIISNVLFQIGDKKTVLLEAKRILKSKGKLLIVDWADSFGGMGPQPQDVLPIMVAEELCKAQGFALERQIPAGEHHYGLIFRKP